MKYAGKPTMTQKWTMRAKARLEGKTIRKVGYISTKCAEDIGWYQRGLMLQLDDDTYVYVQQDDEGNGPGALLLIDPRGGEHILPTLPPEEG